MPRVQTYNRQIDTAPTPRPSRQGYAVPQLQTPPGVVTPSPAALGAQFGSSIAQLGEGIRAQEIARQDAVRLTQAERKLTDWEIDRVYHPEHGALTVQGEGVYGLADSLGEDYDKTAADITAALNERQRLRFDPVVQGKRASIMERVNQHVSAESRQIDVNETKAAIANETAIAIANADDPQYVARSLQNVQQTAASFAVRNHWGVEQTNAFLDGAASDIHVGVIGRFLDQG